MLSTPFKRGSVKFAKTEYTIPMTLFYDEDTNEYLQKQAEVKTYICDENGNTIRSIGKTELNIAEFAMREKFGLEVEIQGENKKKNEEVVITFQIILERQDDDCKSVNSMSDEENDIKGLKQTQLKQKQRDSKSKDKQNFLFPGAQSKITVKSTEQKVKTSNKFQMDEQMSDRTTKYDRKDSSPIKYFKEDKNTGKSKNEEKNKEESHNERFFNKLDKKQQKLKRQISIKRESASIKSPSKESKFDEKKSPRKDSKSPKKPYRQDSQTKNSSAELRLYLAHSKIASLERENGQLKSETERLKSVIEHLIEQKSERQITETSVSSQFQQQMEGLKKVVIEKEMKINELEGLNKIIAKREDEKDRYIKELRGESKELRMKLEHEKNKLAKVLNMAMESENMELLEIIESEISDEFY